MKTSVAIVFLIIAFIAGCISYDGWSSQKDTSGESLGPIFGPFVQWSAGAVAIVALLAAAAIYFT